MECDIVKLLKLWNVALGLIKAKQHRQLVYDRLLEAKKELGLDDLNTLDFMDDVRNALETGNPFEFYYDLNPPEDQDESVPEDRGDKLYPADRQDILVDILERERGKEFRRKDLEKITGFSKDQLQKDLRQLKADGRIGYKEEKECLPNARNPKKPFWRSDWVYFALKKSDPEPELTFPMTVTFNHLDELKAFVESWKNT